ncbi:MAG: hypothetical protein EOO54_28600, partial [Haliea sp.]
MLRFPICRATGTTTGRASTACDRASSPTLRSNPTFFPSTPTPPVATAKAPPGSDVPGASALPSAATNGALPPASGTAPATAVPTAPSTAPRERFTVTTDLLRITFDAEGGSLVRAELLKVTADSVADKKKQPENFVLMEDSPARIYVAQTGLIGGDFPNHKTVMTASGDRELKEGANELVVRFESPEKSGIKLVKTYTLRRGSYAIGVKHEVTNTGTAPVTPQVYMQLTRGAGSSGGSFITNPTGTFTGPGVYTPEQKYQKIEFTDIDKNKVEIQKESTSGWVAMVQHYFVGAWILPDGVKRENFVRKVDALYSVGMIAPLAPVAPGATQAVQAEFFGGPQQEKMLEQVSPGLD